MNVVLTNSVEVRGAERGNWKDFIGASGFVQTSSYDVAGVLPWAKIRYPASKNTPEELVKITTSAVIKVNPEKLQAFATMHDMILSACMTQNITIPFISKGWYNLYWIYTDKYIEQNFLVETIEQ